jgi:glucose-6-phosphate 1-dehydrogenase
MDRSLARSLGSASAAILKVKHLVTLWKQPAQIAELLYVVNSFKGIFVGTKHNVFAAGNFSVDLLEALPGSQFRTALPMAYETLLVDVLSGDVTLFMRTYQIERA